MAVSLRERNKADKRRRILAAARRLFTERGYDGTTTRAIAQAAGVGTGTVYAYAETKLDLLFLLFDSEISAVIEARFTCLPDGPLLDRLVHPFLGFITHYASTPDLAWVMIKEMPFYAGSAESRYIELHTAFFARVAAVVAAEQQAGRVRPSVDPLEAALALFALYGGVVLTWARSGSWSVEAGEALLTRAFAVAVEGLTTR
ncbi:MAG: AcrR family transcriptional regulator [Myxococcota bacterium]